MELQINSTNQLVADLNRVLADPLISLIIMIGVLALVIFILLLILRKFLARQSRIYASLKMKILLITVPKESLKKEHNQQQRPETPESIQQEIGMAENIFSVMGGLKAQRGFKHWLLGRTDHFSFEIVLQEGKIYFYLAVPDKLVETAEQQIHASYPYAQIEEVEDYNIFSAKGSISGTYLKFRREYIFPIKTYKKMSSDPLNGLTNALSKLSAGTGAGIQFVARSAHRRWHYKGVKVARTMEQGKSLSVALRKAGLGNIFDKFFGLFADLLEFFIFKKKKQDNFVESQDTHKLSAMEEEVVKGVEEKTSKAGLDVNIRVVVAAPTLQQSESYLTNICNAFAQFNIYQYGNSFKKAKYYRTAKLISDFIQRHFAPSHKILLNAEELTSLWHLPLPSSETPNIRWLEARKAPPPLNIPERGLTLGKNIFRGITTDIKIGDDDRMRHVYLIGKSGTGKSVLQANMIIQDIKAGKGVCVIDPHGDLIDAVMGHIPPERAEDVIIFDPADYDRPLGLNMLEFQTSEQKTFVINEMIKIFDKLYDLKATGGPMFEQYMRNAMLLMMEDPASGSTLLEVPKVLADASFRRYKLSKCANPVVRDFWEKEAEKAGGEASLANMVPYITSKLTPFVSSDLLRPIVAQQNSAFNFREVMDQQKILLIKLSKGVIGELSANLLGMIIVGRILMAALSRVEVAPEQRQEFYLYIDEFQNFITDSIAIILSEARKYKLGLIIAHQYIGQLAKPNDTSIKDAVFGNVGTIVSFRIGPDDAEFMAKQFAPVFNEYDLINIPAFNAYVKLLINNHNAPGFNMETYPPLQGDLSIVPKIRELSRLKYGRDRNQVEQEILDRLKIVRSVA